MPPAVGEVGAICIADAAGRSWINLAFENTLSEGADDAGIARYFRESFAGNSIENLNCISHIPKDLKRPY